MGEMHRVNRRRREETRRPRKSHNPRSEMGKVTLFRYVSAYDALEEQELTSAGLRQRRP